MKATQKVKLPNQKPRNPLVVPVMQKSVKKHKDKRRKEPKVTSFDTLDD